MVSSQSDSDALKVISTEGFTRQPIVVTLIGAKDVPDSIVDSVVRFTIGKALANENAPDDSDDRSVSTLVAGAPHGRFADNADGIVKHNPMMCRHI